jgi:hypothetical protein
LSAVIRWTGGVPIIIERDACLSPSDATESPIRCRVVAEAHVSATPVALGYTLGHEVGKRMRRAGVIIPWLHRKDFVPNGVIVTTDHRVLQHGTGIRGPIAVCGRLSQSMRCPYEALQNGPLSPGEQVT